MLRCVALSITSIVLFVVCCSVLVIRCWLCAVFGVLHFVCCLLCLFVVYCSLCVVCRLVM